VHTIQSFRHSRESGNPYGYVTEIIKNIFSCKDKKMQKLQQINAIDSKFWIPAFAGMTGVDSCFFKQHHFVSKLKPGRLPG